MPGNKISFAQLIDRAKALRHYQQAIQHAEAREDTYSAGPAKRCSTRAALDNFRQVGVGAAADAADAEQLIAELQRRGQ